jgi:hypothetical protein
MPFDYYRNSFPFPLPPYNSPNLPSVTRHTDTSFATLPSTYQPSPVSVPFPPPQYDLPTSPRSVAVHNDTPSATTLSHFQVFPHSPAEQRSPPRIRRILPRPPVPTITSAQPLTHPPVLLAAETDSSNLSTTCRPLSVQPSVPPRLQPYCVAASSTIELSEDNRHYPGTNRSFPESVRSRLSASISNRPNIAPQAETRTIGSQNSSRRIIHQSLQLLHDGLEQRQTASEAFPPDLSQAQIRASVSRYEEHVKAAAKNGVCSSCGRFVPISEIVELDSDDPLLQPLHGYLDYCGKHENDWDVCLLCLRFLSQNTLPKFSALNRVNMTLCQSYPSVLEDLTPVEECLIAKCHPLGIIIKLRPGGQTSPLNYRASRGHFIVIPQDPEPLLEILPSRDLALHDMVRVFWLGKQPPTHTDLSPFLLVRKHRVLAALQYLIQHNQVYQDLTINHQILDAWSDEFIPPELQENLICVDVADGHEREGYSIELDSGNYENDFQAAQGTTSNLDNDGPLMTGSVSTDINGERQNPERRLLNTLLNMVSDRSPVSAPHVHLRDQQRIPTLSYRMRGHATLVDHWNDPTYFTAAFPTLFPHGIGGHLEDRPFAISIASFAEWALKHHSRRYVPPNKSIHHF